MAVSVCYVVLEWIGIRSNIEGQVSCSALNNPVGLFSAAGESNKTFQWMVVVVFIMVRLILIRLTKNFSAPEQGWSALDCRLMI